MKKIDLKQKDQIINLYKSGMNGTQISEKTGIPYSSVLYHVAKIKKRTSEINHAVTDSPRIQNNVSQELMFERAKNAVLIEIMKQGYTLKKV